MTAIISPCGKFRYCLERQLGPGKTCMFIMLNPSTADAVINDRTITRCIGFATSLGYGKLIVGNLFAFRATKPANLKKAKDPEGPDNLKHLKRMCASADLVIAAWGTDGKFRKQGERIRKLLEAAGVRLHYLELTKKGHPKHPLYIKADRTPVLWL